MVVIQLPRYALLTLGFIFTFAWCWVFDKGFRLLFAPLMNKVAGIGFGGFHGIGAVHPFSFLHTIVTNVENWTARGMQASERGITYSLSQLIDTFGLFFGVPLAIALALYELAQFAAHQIGKAVTRVEHTTVIKKIGTATKVITSVTAQQFHVLANRITRAEHAIAHLTTAIAHGVAHLPARVGLTSKQIRRMERSLARVEKATVGAGAVALVGAVALRLGFKWFKCQSFRKVGKRLNCGSWAFLDSLLSLAIDLLLITNLCTVSRLLTRLGHAVQPMLTSLTIGAEELFQCQGVSRPPNMGIAEAALPVLDESVVSL